MAILRVADTLNNHENATHFAGDCNQKYFLNYQLQEFVMA